LQKLVYAIGGFFVLLLLVGLVLPRQTHVVVSTDIDAHAATVFAQLNDLRRTDLWAPISDVDANARVTFSGPARGTGATITWDGAVAGSGTQTIVQSRAYDYVETLINGGEPGESRTWFELTTGAGRTNVRWGFEHDYGYNVVGRYFGLMVANVIRRDQQRGIEALKALAESLPRADFSDLEIERLLVEPMNIAYKPTRSSPEPAAVSQALGDSYFEVLGFMDEHRLALAGAPLSITRTFSGNELYFDAGIPVRGVTDSTPRDDASVRLGRSYGGTAIRVRHVGPYRTLSRTHRKIGAYLAALGIQKSGDAWESYVSDPTEVDESELLTYIYYPVRD